MTRHSDAVKLQLEIAAKVVDRDDFSSLENVCAADVAYDSETAYCSAVVMSMQGKMIEAADSASPIEYPYVPGVLMLRESGPVLRTLGKLKSSYDLLLVDGHGRLHPRRCGIACYLGVTLDKPTIGVAKSMLCGNVQSDGSIELDGEILGHAICERLYVSVGHRISLSAAVAIVRELGNGAAPKVLRLADENSKNQKRGKGRSRI